MGDRGTLIQGGNNNERCVCGGKHVKGGNELDEGTEVVKTSER